MWIVSGGVKAMLDVGYTRPAAQPHAPEDDILQPSISGRDSVPPDRYQAWHTCPVYLIKLLFCHRCCCGNLYCLNHGRTLADDVQMMPFCCICIIQLQDVMGRRCGSCR